MFHVDARRPVEPDLDHTTRLITQPHSIDTLLTPIIATKLIVPPAGAAQIARPHLLSCLDSGLYRPLTLVLAPAGYGKTSLLSAWARQSSASCAWLSLDASDSEPYQFWAYVIATLEAAQPALGSRIRLLLPGPEASIEQVLAALINALSEADPLALVIDNYQLIATDIVHQSLAFLLDHMPTTFHVVLASRAEPPLPLAHWRLAGMLNDLGAADLRFSQGEAAGLLTQALAPATTADTIAALVSQAEGWAAGLRLAARFVSESDDSASAIGHFGGYRGIQDYLEEEVLGPLPAHIQAFLLQTSVLDRLCAPLCDALLEVGSTALHARGQVSHERLARSPARYAHVFDSYSQMILAQVERAGLFLIALDAERTWYRYHLLFAEALRYRLNQEAPALAAALRQRAADWYAEHDVAPGENDAIALPLFKAGFPSAAPRSDRPNIDFVLSSREQDVLRLLVEGCSNQDIAATLIIGVNTVKMHVKHIYAKLDAHNRTQAVARARRIGLA